MTPKKPKHLRYTAGTRGGTLANGRPLSAALTPKLAAARREPLSRAEEEAAAVARDRAALARFFKTVLKT